MVGGLYVYMVYSMVCVAVEYCVLVYDTLYV